MIRRRVLVRGRVQGVFFRDSCRREAEARGVNGWVANRLDGGVEAVFEGSLLAVERMVSWMRQGPPDANVSHVWVDQEDPQGEGPFVVLPDRGR